MQTRAELLKNLAKARAVRKQNLAMRRNPQTQRSPQRRVVQRRVRPQSRFVRVARNVPIINPQILVNPDLDVTRTDLGGANEGVSSSDLDVTKTDVRGANERVSSGESIVAGIDDVFPRVLQRRR